MEERRAFVRLDTRLHVSCTVLPAAEAQRTTTKNIGAGGICVFLDEVLPVGTPLQVTMQLPGREEAVHFTGEVTWCEQYEVVGKTERQRAVEAGVRFVEIAPKDQEALMQHVILSVKPRQSIS